MDKNPHIFLTKANQQKQEIKRHFDVTLNHFGTMVSPNAPSGMPSCEGEKESKITKTIDPEWTGLSISARLDNKPKQKYGLFSKYSL